MIKADGKILAIKGPEEEIKADFFAIVYSLAGEIDETMLRKYFELGVSASKCSFDTLSAVVSLLEKFSEEKK